ncbi:ninjurin-1 isoform X4 [Manis javanica]|uniref:ninjurin-1 isoform X4 n=1 Tax=Manis javanica TaxID=9974 RepID=UPI0018795425|nr:ninjurin-1 isoform X7 [Manis javanica]
MDSGAEEYELNGDLRPGSPGSPDASPSHWRRNRPINVNHYANKKSAAESMLDIALLMANASQLKVVIEQGPSFAFFMPLVVLISISLVLQIGVGVLLIFLVGVRTRPGVGVRIARSLCIVLRGACSALCAFKPRPGRGHALRSLTRHWLLVRKQGLQGDGRQAARYDLNNPAKHAKLDFLNNLATGLVFIIVVVNIFITAFGVQKPGVDAAPRQ